MLTIVQTTTPDYRLQVFRQVRKECRGDFKVVSGSDYFTPTIRNAAEGEDWHERVTNRFLVFRCFLWQSGVERRTKDADIVVCEFNPRILSTWWLLWRRRRAGKRTLLWGHVTGRRGGHFFGRWARLTMCRLSDGLICYTQTEADRIRRDLSPGFPLHTATNSCVTRAECRASSGENAWNVIYVGRLVASKKPLVLIRAFALVVADLPSDARLIMVGDGPQREPCEAEARRLGIAKRVDFYGHVGDPTRLKEIYGRAIVAVSPGYAGLSAIQCMAYGVPMLISRDEFHSPEIEACIPEQTCRFFKTNDPPDLARHLLGFVEERTTWLARGPEIAAHIAGHYTIEGMARAFTEATQTPSRSTADLAVLVWAQYGPYHQARLRALLDAGAGKLDIVGVELASRTTTYRWEARRDNLPLLTLFPDRDAESLGAAEIFRRAYDLFRTIRPTVAFIPSYWPESSFGLLLAARALGVPLVMMNDSHGDTSRASGLRLLAKRRIVQSFRSALLAGTPHIDYFASMGLPRERLFDGYDVVDNKHFATQAADCRERAGKLRVRYGLPARFFLNVGRMEPKKNLSLLVEAFARVRLSDPASPSLVFVGAGTEEGNLRQKCIEQGLSFADLSCVPQPEGAAAKACGDVYFYGFRQIDELPIFYALATAFVLPSSSEEWGLVVNEAMACGLPVLVSKVAGCATDLVREGENGFLLDPNDAGTLAERLAELSASSERAEEMGIQSQKIISQWGLSRFARNALCAAEAAQAVSRITKTNSSIPVPGSVHRTRQRPWGIAGHGLAVGGLFLLDDVLAFSRRKRHARLRSLAIFAGLACAIMVIFCGNVLFRVNKTTNTILRDALVGLDGTLDMGKEVADSQARLVDYSLDHAHAPADLAERFRRPFEASFATYGGGVLSREEQIIGDEIRDREARYKTALQSLRTKEFSLAAWRKAYNAGIELRGAVRARALFNAQRVQSLTLTNRSATFEVFFLSCGLLLSLALFLGFVLTSFAVTRLINETEKKN